MGVDRPIWDRLMVVDVLSKLFSCTDFFRCCFLVTLFTPKRELPCFQDLFCLSLRTRSIRGRSNVNSHFVTTSPSQMDHTDFIIASQPIKCLRIIINKFKKIERTDVMT